MIVRTKVMNLKLLFFFPLLLSVPLVRCGSINHRLGELELEQNRLGGGGAFTFMGSLARPSLLYPGENC